MSGTGARNGRLTKRLAPLYAAVFLQSFVLWYTIEKLFMRSIGFSDTTIGFMIAVYSAVMLVVETPSGILADRWSRKGVLMLAGVCLAASSLVGGISHGVGVYLVAAVLWGMFFACYSGMYDSIVYDTVAETSEDSRLFEFLYGRVQLVEGVALVAGGLAGGLVSEFIGLRAAYFLAVPFALLSVLALAKFHEPTLHKKQVLQPITSQLSATFRAVLQNRYLLPVVVVLVLRSTLIYMLYEFSQLWLLALHTPTKYYGLAYAILISSTGVGGVLAHRWRLSGYRRMLGTLLVTLLGCVGLIILRDRGTALIVAAQFVMATGLVSISIIFNRILHDNLGPSIRAGAASATSTIGRFLIVPLALAFGYSSQRFSVYEASYILLVCTVLMIVFVAVVASRHDRTGLEARLASSRSN